MSLPGKEGMHSSPGDPGNSNLGNSNFALSGRIMLSAIVILFAVVVLMICLHIYARWYLLRARHRQRLRRRGRRRTHLIFYVEPNAPADASRGLDASVLSSLPVFVYSAAAHPDALECAVCLCEFEENEKVRLLPKCNHSFHTECIDMWFHSHSTCPLCRSPVEAVPENCSNVVVSVGEPDVAEAASCSGPCAACRHEEDVSLTSSSSLADRRKAFEPANVRIDVPSRAELVDELGLISPASHGTKSPSSRLLSLRRILSMNRKGPAVSPSSERGTSCGGATAELETESGGQESSRLQTPR